jgi:hypothetical protein
MRCSKLGTAVLWAGGPLLTCLWLSQMGWLWGSGIVQTAYNLVQQAGTPLTMRTTLNCSTGMSCSDDATNKVTVLTAVGSGGSVTSVATGCGLSGGTITTTGTIVASLPTNAQTGTTYTFLSTDCGKLVTFSNTGAIAASLPASGSAGFPSGYEVDVENLNSGVLTITPATSTIDGAAAITLTQNQGIRIFSDGTNYHTQRGRENVNITVRGIGASFDGAGSALTSGKTTYFTIPFTCTITGYNITADTGTVSFDVWKIATGTAIPTVANTILTGGYLALATGTALHSTSVSLFTTTTVTAFDIFGINLEAVSGATEVSLVLACNASTA